MKKMFRGRVVRRVVAIFLMLSLVAVATAAPLPAAPLEGKIHPLLSKLADANPTGTVRVIVQGKNAHGELDAKIALRGGLKKKALPMVKGIAAEVPAGQVRELAQDPDVNWVTMDARMLPSVITSTIGTVYPFAVRAPEVWNGATPYTGAGVGVAVLDSGINPTGPANAADFRGRILANASMATGSPFDNYGHGTHVAGIISGGGAGSDGKYVGIAPSVNLINVKVSDDRGTIYLSDVVDGLQWAVANRAKYGIRVVNLSLISSVAESYQTSPLDAAVELAWLSGIAVVVSAGNLGANSVYYPPANDPLVITVGAVDNNGTAGIADDVVPSWSSYGTTQDGFSKPEVAAPGRQIVSNLASRNALLAQQMPDRIVDKYYFRLSGTSTSAPVVSGIAALALQAHPNWTPDQVKSALMASARALSSTGAGKGEVDAAAAVSLAAPGFANRGVALNLGVAKVAGTANYDSATWNSATWNSATWNSATWNSATWNSATWNSATWNSATWNSATWNSATWNSATWNSATWNSATWNAFPD